MRRFTFIDIARPLGIESPETVQLGIDISDWVDKNCHVERVWSAQPKTFPNQSQPWFKQAVRDYPGEIFAAVLEAMRAQHEMKQRQGELF